MAAAGRPTRNGVYRGAVEANLVALQARILDHVAALVAPGGLLAYMTCSVLEAEKRRSGGRVPVARHPGFQRIDQQAWTPLTGGRRVLSGPAATGLTQI